MPVLWISTLVMLGALVLVLGFLLLGVLRNVGLLTWRVEQLEATTPSRLGRSGLAPGKKAPDFTLASVGNGEVSLREFAGRKILLVFVQTHCEPCHEIVPELNKFAAQHSEIQIIAVNHATPEEAREWIAETKARFPVLIQEDWAISKRYEVFATPFAFLIDEQGLVAAKGIVSQRHHLGYLLASVAPKAHVPANEDCDAVAAEKVSVAAREENAKQDEVAPVKVQF
jgi:methylamine dehydrogenase accessory protein MauD